MDIKYVLFMAVAMILVSGCIGDNNTAGRQERAITIGMPVAPISALLMVAKDGGFFDNEGVKVDLVEFTGGKFAMQAFLSGSIDMAATSEVPVMFSLMQDNKFQVMTQLVERTHGEVRIVALKEPGLSTPEEYFKTKRRKLATFFGAGPEFYSYSFLKKKGITDVEIVSMKPEDMPAALQTGSVDAIAIFDPFAFFAEKGLGERALRFNDESLYSELFVLSAKGDWINSNPEVAQNLVRSLVKASKYMDENPDAAKAIVMKRTKLDRQAIDGIWSNFVFKPALNGQLLEYLDAEAKWAKETGKVKNETGIPDLRGYINTGPMRTIIPEAVTI